MRPVNLIPPEDRRGERAPLRSGPLAYIIVATLLLAFVGVYLTVKAGNTISEEKASVAGLEQDLEAATARAEALQGFTSFATLEQTRTATVDSLARSRFDWERVIDELSRVIPADIWLTELTATATPDASIDGSAGLALRSQIEGPALELVGCGRDHESVAGLIAALEDIDGVTRVTATKSAKAPAGSSGSGGGSGGGSEDCQTRPSVAAFGLVVGFEGVPSSELPVPGTVPGAESAVPTAATGSQAPAATISEPTP